MGWLYERRWQFNNGRRNINKMEEDCERWQPVSAWSRKRRSTQLRPGTPCGMNFSGNKKAECPLQDTQIL